ncbi:MAG: polyribonucleotide nucleotidyltransferase, partial [Serratia symbiotica]|nr:polyribonucleotide nucleotidyltransferase [Serratia symbiotica]
IIGTSAALSLSGIPFYGPLGASRVGYIDNKYVLNPTIDDIKSSSLDLIIAGTQSAILMVEAEAKILSEEEILEAIFFGHQQQQVVINNIRALSNEARKLPWIIDYPEKNQSLEVKILELCKNDIS